MNYPDLTTLSPKMQAWEKLALVSEIARKMEVQGVTIGTASIEEKRAEIMTYQPLQLWCFLDTIGAEPEAKLRATYTMFPLEVSGTVNGVRIHCYGTQKDFENIETAKKNKEARKNG